MQTKREVFLHKLAKALSKHVNASFDILAKESGISRATLYRHFDSRKSLIQELGEYTIKASVIHLQEAQDESKNAYDAIRLLLKKNLYLGEFFYVLYFDEEAKNDKNLQRAYQTYAYELYKLIQRAKKEGFIRKDLSSEWLVYFLDYSLFASCNCMQDGFLNTKEAPNVLLQSIFEGIYS